MHILPSRGRPAGLQRFFTEGKPSEKGVLVLDADQVPMYGHIRLPPNWAKITVTPRSGYVKAANAGFAAFPDEPWYGLSSDDAVGRTKNWDTILGAAATPDTIVWPNDLINGRCTQPFVGGDLCRKLGWFVHPAFGHLYCDLVWGLLSAALGTGGYMPEVVLEHLHYSIGKAPNDATYQGRKQKGDGAVFEKLDLIGLMEKIKPCITQNDIAAASAVLAPLRLSRTSVILS